MHAPSMSSIVTPEQYVDASKAAIATGMKIVGVEVRSKVDMTASDLMLDHHFCALLKKQVRQLGIPLIPLIRVNTR